MITFFLYKLLLERKIAVKKNEKSDLPCFMEVISWRCASMIKVTGQRVSGTCITYNIQI